MRLVFGGLVGKEDPRTVEKDISCKLLLVLIHPDCRSVDPNDISHVLRHWQIFKFVSKQNQVAVVDSVQVFLVDLAACVGYLE